MAIKRNDITIGISGSDLEKFQEQQMNDFQEKRITWQGEDNVLVTTVLQRLYEFAAGKVQIILADTMPSSTEPNTQYWVKTYSGTTLDDGRFVIMTDTLNNATFIGKSSADLTEFYTKTEIDTKLTDLTTSSFRDGVVLSTLGNSDNAKTLVSGQAARVALGNKQDKITASDQLTTPTDSDKLSYLNNVTNNRWTFSKIWDWIVTKLTGNTEKGIQVSGGKLGHTNALTPPSTSARFLCGVLDEQGHFKATPTAFQYSSVYNSNLENCLFTRTGANNMYNYFKPTSTDLTMTLSSSSEISINANDSKLFKIGNLNIIYVNLTLKTNTSWGASTSYITLSTTFSGTLKTELAKVKSSDSAHIAFAAINQAGMYPTDAVDFYNITSSGANIRISARNGLASSSYIKVMGTFVYLS